MYKRQSKFTWYPGKYWDLKDYESVAKKQLIFNRGLFFTLGRNAIHSQGGWTSYWIKAAILYIGTIRLRDRGYCAFGRIQMTYVRSDIMMMHCYLHTAPFLGWGGGGGVGYAFVLYFEACLSGNFTRG